MLKKIKDDILNLVNQLEKLVQNITSQILLNNKNHQNRTIKQILGHLCDSATNNTHRIIHLQYQNGLLNYPDYANLGNNDKWIQIQDYKNYDLDVLVNLFKYTNIHIANTINIIDKSKLQNKWESALNEKFSLEEIIIDYPKHLKLHLTQIKNLLE